MDTRLSSRREPVPTRRPAFLLPGLAVLCLLSAVPVSADTPPAALFERFENFDAARFTEPTAVDNEWFAFEPGTQWIWEGTTVDDEGEVLPHRVVITATGLVKRIGAIPCVVTYDLDYEDGDLVEAEIAFFAQDDEGNVWRMGEYPEEYDDEIIVAAPTWIHGIEGAVGGITMKGDPTVSGPGYSEGWAPGVHFSDRGRVQKFVAENCVPLDCYENVLVIEETALDEVGAFHLKYWAEGVGNTRVGWGGEGEMTQEVLELTALEMLDADALAKVHEDAFALEKSAFKISPDIYGKTAPMELSAD